MTHSPSRFANGTSLSPAVQIGAKVLVGIIMPAAWDAAALTFQTSTDDSNYLSMVNSGGTEINFTVAAATYIAIDPTMWHGVRELKIRSGTAASPVNQSADRALVLVCRSNIT